MAAAEVAARKRRRGKRGNLFHAHVPSPKNDKYIQWLAQQDLGWKPNPCMLTKSHPGYAECQRPDDDEAEALLELEEPSFAETEEQISDPSVAKNLPVKNAGGAAEKKATPMKKATEKKATAGELKKASAGKQNKAAVGEKKTAAVVSKKNEAQKKEV